MANRLGGQCTHDDRTGQALGPRLTDRQPRSLRLELEMLRLEWLLKECAEQGPRLGRRSA